LWHTPRATQNYRHTWQPSERDSNDFGWQEGRNIRIDIRFAPAGAGQKQLRSQEFVALKPDVILAQSPQVVTALQRESRAIPIVFVGVADPVGAGFIIAHKLFLAKIDTFKNKLSERRRADGASCGKRAASGVVPCSFRSTNPGFREGLK
jgi:hypothetical protein